MGDTHAFEARRVVGNSLRGIGAENKLKLGVNDLIYASVRVGII